MAGEKEGNKKLTKDDGVWTNDEVEMHGMASDYFKSIFTQDDNVNPAEIVNLFDECISPKMNLALTKPYSEEEISNALFQIGPLKALGLGGYPGRFFQRNKLLLKDDVIPAVQKFLESGNMPPGVNDTCIVLIPKITEPETTKDFRPISLCNVIYKIMSKCLVNRLRSLLQDIISSNQSAFIQGRVITDNALIVFECLHAIKTSSDNKSQFCAYKLDLLKAYNRIDWGFLNDVLLKLGFQST